MKLPNEFIQKYERLLGSDFESFVASFDFLPIAGFRVNPLKEIDVNLVTKLGKKLPSSDFGYLGKISGRSIEFLTGQVYSQEPAAQQVGQMAEPQEGQRVLDLCAAPGGKSTHLLSYLKNTGLLVANEISSSRAKVLVENLERFGARNTIVMNEHPKHLSAAFEDYFDVIIVDAPCSGEGMFRKNPEAVKYWSQDYVLECAKRQREILREAVKMLTADGTLIYSTCTWSPEEDEEIVHWLLQEYPTFELRTQKKLWPHEFQGEGQFVARLEDKSAAPRRAFQKKSKAIKAKLTTEQKKLWTDFKEENLQTDLRGNLQTFAENLYLLPEDLPDLSHYKIARNGLHLGVFKKDRFEPSYALGLTLSPKEVKHHIHLDREEFKRYIAGESIPLKEAEKKGWYQILIENNGLGFAKVAGNILKNYYPKGLRQKIE